MGKIEQSSWREEATANEELASETHTTSFGEGNDVKT